MKDEREETKSDSSRNSERKMEADEERLLDELGLHGESRRQFLGQVAASGLGILAVQQLAGQNVFAADSIEIAAPAPVENAVKVAFKVNGAEKSLNVDSRMTLLDALRERLDLTGSKKGCDQGQCGACTVIVEGRRVLSCLTLAATCEGKSVTTIEGLAKGDELHQMQAAFIKHDGFQCGLLHTGTDFVRRSRFSTKRKTAKRAMSPPTCGAEAVRFKCRTTKIRERMSGKSVVAAERIQTSSRRLKKFHTGKDVAQNWQFVGENNQAIFDVNEQTQKGESTQ